MADLTVKQKLGIFHNFGARVGKHSSKLLVGCGLLTFIASLAGWFPAGTVEIWYARGLFPRISRWTGLLADAVPFAWLDLVVAAIVVLGLLAVRQRRFRTLISTVAMLYLFFFWSWGLNYHRQPLVSKLPFDRSRAGAEAVDRLTKRTAAELNRLYGRQGSGGVTAAQRVAKVIVTIDGAEWNAASRVKSSVLVNPWLRVAGVDGLFNPFGHEPIVSTTLLDVEEPFVTAHEFAHVRGYPNEGDANMIALLATILSDDPSHQYSGWLHLWFYVRNREVDKLLDDGPERDVQRIFERSRRDRIQWLSNLQTAILDLFLKANSVEEGVRSYAEIVVLAAGTEENWDRFR